MADTLNQTNKKISAKSLLGDDRVEKYRQELVVQGKIPGTNLNATSEERKTGFNLYKKNKIDFQKFVEKVIQKRGEYQGVGGNGGAGIYSPFKRTFRASGVIVKRTKTDISIFDKHKGVQQSSLSTLKVLNSILDTLKKQFDFDKKESDTERKEEETGRRKKREDALEAVKKISGKIIEKVVAPFQNILDRIWKFIFFTLLGRAFTKLMDWLGDPKNAQKVATLGRFLKDWWPALLGLYFNPFRGFMLKTLGKIAWFGARFAFKNPLITTATIGYVARQKERERIKPYVEKDLKSTEQTLSDKKAPWYQKLGAYFAKEQLTGPRGPSDPLTMPVPSAMYASGGLIDSNTGIKISGAGADTQLTALQPGEIVMNRAAVRGIGAKKLLALNKMFGGSNANKPRYTGNIQTAKDGGIVGGKSFAGTSMFGDVPLIRAASAAGIKGVELAAFLSQMSHETGGFKWNRELGRGEGMGYSGGSKYHGRGYTQLTHDYNYKHFGDKLGVDLLKDPDILIKDPNISARVAVEYWKEKVRPSVKDWSDVFSVSRAINNPSASSPTSINGWEDRVSKFNEYRAKLNSGSLNLSSTKLLTKPSSKPSSKVKPNPKYKSKDNFWGNVFALMPTSLPFAGGGLVKENSGLNINGATADRQLTSLQPGEYVLPVDTVNNLGTSLIDKLVAMTDSNSTAAKIGKNVNRYIPTSLSRGRGVVMQPPITQSIGGGGGGYASGTDTVSFSTVSPSGSSDRAMNASIYGIIG